MGKNRTLGLLARLERNELTRERRRLAAAEDARDAERRATRELELRLQAESRLGAETPELRPAFTAFGIATTRRKREIARREAAASAAAETARGEVEARFLSVKQLELAAERMAARARAEEERRERLRLDEAALGLHRRKIAASG